MPYGRPWVTILNLIIDISNKVCHTCLKMISLLFKKQSCLLSVVVIHKFSITLMVPRDLSNILKNVRSLTLRFRNGLQTLNQTCVIMTRHTSSVQLSCKMFSSILKVFSKILS